MTESARFRLHRLLAEYRAGALDAEAFCQAFEHTYNMELDKRTLSTRESEVFAELFESVTWFSPFPDEVARIAHQRAAIATTTASAR